MARGMDGMASMGLEPWTSTTFGLMLAMWVIMMVGMMLPSATPTTAR